MAESSVESSHRTDDGTGARWEAPETSPLTVVAHQVRMRYKTPRRDRTPRKTLLGKLTKRPQMVSVPAVRGVNLQVREGEFIGIIGRNGSGKSTLLRMLAGVEPPSSGLVLTRYRPQLLGVSAALMSSLTGAENIRMGFLALGMSDQQTDAKFDAAAELSALGDAIDLPMKTYSSGMSARLKFAISVMAEPKILMIDEALSTGDSTFAERSRRKMDELLENAGTVFMVNHAPKAIETMCSRVIWMERGRIVMDGDTLDISDRYKRFARALADENQEESDAILAQAVLDGAQSRQRAALSLPSDREPRVREQLPEMGTDPFAEILFQDGLESKKFPTMLNMPGG